MAALAVALIVLGGGYSLAFSGSGTLQKENEIGITEAVGGETIRTVSGAGSLKARCFDLGTDVSVVIYFQNTSGEALTVYADQVGEGGVQADPFVDSAVPSGTTVDIGTEFDGESGVMRAHIFPANGSKQPQVDATISSSSGDTDACSMAHVAVLNLTTEG